MEDEILEFPKYTQLDLFNDTPTYSDLDNFDENGVEAKVKSGELWQLGNHRLLCGDATKEEDVDKLVGDGCIDLWVTDPPYNVDYQGKTKSVLTIHNDKFKDKTAFCNFLTDAFACIKKHLVEGGGVLYMVCFKKSHRI